MVAGADRDCDEQEALFHVECVNSRTWDELDVNNRVSSNALKDLKDLKRIWLWFAVELRALPLAVCILTSSNGEFVDSAVSAVPSMQAL
mmetsp:Transcript_3915/g.10599  ORF Transcript_3915/g.10599 Transcript_3915/m.10599 type:complete len:89 (+) Transcript_3915:457-723(+)|eukprot:1150497-Pelagomonas_calceolata.AAC.1